MSPNTGSPSNKKIICFDLEGPVSPQDNAYDVMTLFGGGDRIFEVLSRYDDIMSLEGRPDYEPGDTLSLTVPFLLHHGISEEDIVRVSSESSLVDGVEYTMARLMDCGWKPYIISTSYEYHAYSIGGRIGIPKENVYCTKLPLSRLYEQIGEHELSLVERLEEDILKRLYPQLEDKKIRERLDRFYKKEIVGSPLHEIIREMKVVGGSRKTDTLVEIAENNSKSLGEVFVVGDSITDYKMLDRIKSAGGVSLVFNGNRYAIPYGNVGLACSSILPILILADAFSLGGSKKVLETARVWSKNRGYFNENPDRVPSEYIPEDVKSFLVEHFMDEHFIKPSIDYLLDADEEKQKDIVRTHNIVREYVRGRAAKLS